MISFLATELKFRLRKKTFCGVEEKTRGIKITNNPAIKTTIRRNKKALIFE